MKNSIAGYLLAACLLLVPIGARAENHGACREYLSVIGLAEKDVAKAGVKIDARCSRDEKLIIARQNGNLGTAYLMSLGGLNNPFVLAEMAKRYPPDTSLVGKLVQLQTAEFAIKAMAFGARDMDRLTAYGTLFGVQKMQVIRKMSAEPYRLEIDTFLSKLSDAPELKVAECTFPIDAYNLPFQLLMNSDAYKTCVRKQ